MPPKCEKRGCEKGAAKKLRFTELVHRNIDTDRLFIFVRSMPRSAAIRQNGCQRGEKLA
jgi:hypothetical protein